MSSSGTLRTFPSPVCSAALLDAQRQFAQRYPDEDIRWTPEENLHLTLVFLGDQRPEDLRHLTRVLNQHLRYSPFTLVMETLAPFPGNPARILAARVNTSPELSKLHQQVSALVDELGISRDTKSFKPHITLGRSRRGIRAPEQRFHATSQATALTLFHSETLSNGVRYKPLAEFVFR